MTVKEDINEEGAEKNNMRIQKETGMRKFSELVSIPSPTEGRRERIRGSFSVAKSKDDKMLAFGWASVAVRTDGEQVEDLQGDIIDPEDLEEAVYDYVQFYGDGGEMHRRGGVAKLVESVVFTKEKARFMGIPDGTVPEGWWIGFRVLDPDVWDKVKDGTYSMFSIEGTGARVEV